MAPWIFTVGLFILGSIFGSFFNVCIYRIPERLSIVYPASRCPSCRKPIPFYWNIPLISYLLLGAKCRYCKAPIAFQYFFVELLSAVTMLFLYYRFGLSWSFAASYAFAAVLIVISFIDLAHQIIPDSISLPGIPFFFLCSFIVPWTSPLDSLIGIVAGGGVIYLCAQGYYLLKKEEGMGGGDMKLLAMIGAFVGWKGALVTLMLASFAGSIVGLALIAAQGKNLKYRIPFGPYLAAGAFVTMLYGNDIIAWYLSFGAR